MILGVGTDLVQISRIRRVGLQRLGDRILAEGEQALQPEGEERLAEWLAGRFAAKEAVAKAAGTGIGGNLAFQDIEIQRDENGKPSVRIASGVLARLGWDRSVTVHLSITHSGDHAVAFAVVERR